LATLSTPPGNIPRQGNFQQLVSRQPESEAAKHKLDGRPPENGPSSPDPTAPEPFETLQAELQQPDGPKVRRDLPLGHVESDSRAAGSAPISAFMEESIDDDTQKFISQSLTDVDLFASYGLTQKAIGLLEPFFAAPLSTHRHSKNCWISFSARAMIAAPPNSRPARTHSYGAR